MIYLDNTTILKDMLQEYVSIDNDRRQILNNLREGTKENINRLESRRETLMSSIVKNLLIQNCYTKKDNLWILEEDSHGN